MVEANRPFTAAITPAHVGVAVAGRLPSPRARETPSVELHHRHDPSGAAAAGSEEQPESPAAAARKLAHGEFWETHDTSHLAGDVYNLAKSSPWPPALANRLMAGRKW